MSAIMEIKARQILDSRGNPTVEVDITPATGARERAAVTVLCSKACADKFDGQGTKS